MGHARKREAIHLPLPHLSYLLGLYPLCMKELAWKLDLPAAPGRTLYAVLVLTMHMPISTMQKLDAMFRVPVQWIPSIP